MEKPVHKTNTYTISLKPAIGIKALAIMWWCTFLTFGLFPHVNASIFDIGLGDPIQAFSKDVFTRLGKEETGNMVFSPYSIHTTMAMALAGSPENSKTYQVRNSLKISWTNFTIH